MKERTQRDLRLDFYDEPSYLVKNNQDNDLNDNKLPILVSIKVNRDPISDKKLAIKKYVDDSIEDGTILRLNQTLEKCLKISVGNDTYNLTKFKKIQLTDTTTITYPNSGGYLSPGREIFVMIEIITVNTKLSKINENKFSMISLRSHSFTAYWECFYVHRDIFKQSW